VTLYTVVWLQDAINDLGDIWLAFQDRTAVTVASAEIDRELARDARGKGRPLSEGLRVFDAPPLRAVFSISEPDRRVEVARVRAL
jgi:plasmid stabilization system protein ParE